MVSPSDSLSESSRVNEVNERNEKFLTLYCSNCRRGLMDLLIRPGDESWTVRATCGYPDCGDGSFRRAIKGKISPAPHESSGVRRTSIVGQEIVDSEVTFHTKPV